MKTVLVLGLSTLILSMDAEASLSSIRPEVQPDPPISAQASPWAVSQGSSIAAQNQLARVYIDLGIHAPIGRHGRIDLYFGGPSHYYGYPSHYRYRQHYRHHRPHYRHHYRPYKRHFRHHYRHHYRPHPHHWKRHHYRKYDHRGRHYGPARRYGH